ncbi:MAG: hypothetical protein QM784_29195 [Polyangiaceae bacterium]
MRRITVGTIFTLTMLLAQLAGAEPPKTAGEQKAVAIYQKSLKGDGLLAAGRYGEAASVFGAAFKDLSTLLEADDEVARFELDVAAADLPNARALRLGYSEIESAGRGEMRTDRFGDLLEELAQQAKLASTGDSNLGDDQIADEAVRVIHELAANQPDPEAPSARARLSLAIAKLEGAIKRTASLAKKNIDGAAASATLENGRKRLKALGEQANKASSAASATVPQGAQIARQVLMEQLDKMEAALSGGDGFIADSDFTGWLVNPSRNLADASSTIKKAYDQADKPMPANAAQPLADKAARLKELAISRAASFKGPAKLVADKDIEARVKKQLTGNLPGVKILKIGMEGSEWGINKDDIGRIESRYRYGYVLYQVPGEKYPRCSRFSYREQYDGKKYVKANGASAYSATRWQTVQ